MALNKFPALKKVVGITLLLCILNNIVAPGIAFALTSGPVNPDSMSFEPVDTTDMVNLLSGDLAYNIPLIDIPGPEGGYPLSLSYHAGIMPDEEASWAGLGWALTPGAINRTVSGFPDDFSGEQNVVRDYWDGGRTNSTSVGVNVGITGVLSANVGLTVSNDTFEGVGIGGYVGLSLGKGVQASIGVAVDPFSHNLSLYGGGDLNLASSVKLSGPLSVNGRMNLGFQINSDGLNVGASAGVGVGLSLSSKDAKGEGVQLSLIGASLNSGGGGVAMSGPGGYSNVENVSAGKIQTQSRSWGITIPITGWLSISLKRNYQRYWSDEASAVSTFGSLNYPDIRENSEYKLEYDTYYLADVNDSSYDLLGKNDPMKSTGGSFADYDTYAVIGQGISGYIRPYGYQMEVAGKSKNISAFTTNRQTLSPYQRRVCQIDPSSLYEVDCQWIEDYKVNTNNPDKLGFRFINDFSNRYEQQNLLADNSNSMNFDLHPTYGNNDGDYGYDTSNEKIASSRNIEYFTNDEIKIGAAKLKGFIDNKASGFDRGKNPGNNTTITNADKRIGGFMVTNESGVTYHYALPTYAYDEYTKTENIYGVRKYNQQNRSNPYATSWLLTAVTGPDYVDINNNGYVDQGDWGYWVSFEYGKWTDKYAWRNPGIGTKKDLDGNFKYHSTGKREIYYLDAVITPTHTALFEKEIRADGKGTSSVNESDPYNGVPVSQLRLNNIILVKNDAIENINTIRASSGTYTGSGYNIIDKDDVAIRTQIQAGIIRKINFGYDYSLCPDTPNSFDESGSLYSASPPNSSTMPRLGKLTLNSLTFLGKGGQQNIPPIQFEYELPDDLVKKSDNVVFLNKKANSDVYVFKIADFQLGSSSDFNQGDIIKFNHNGFIFYALIKQVANVANAGGNSYNKTMEVKYLSTPINLPSSSDRYSWSTTKNPPFFPENYDMWGLYKADYVSFSGNDNLSRLPSKASAQSTDVWSLRRVRQSLGMTTDIVYESDVYSSVALYRNAAIQINTVQPIAATGIFKAESKSDFGIDLRDFIRAGDRIKLNISGDYSYLSDENQDGNHSTITDGVSLSSGAEPNLLVTEVGENYVIINDQKFYNDLFVTQPGTSYYGGNMSAGGIGNNYGGGIRIKKVSNTEPITGVNMAVNYNYNEPENTQLSSGTTSYEPLGVDAVSLRAGANAGAFQSELLKSFSKLLGVVRDVPAPGIMYKYVSVSSERTADGQTIQQLGRSQYQFEVFNEGMIGLWNLKSVKSQYSELSNILLQNNTSRVGNLHRIIKYDANDNKLSEVINHYLHDEQKGNSAQANRDEYKGLLARYNDQGVVMERTAEGRYNDGKSRHVMSTRETYPNIMTGSTSIDYKTGLKTSSQTLAFDFYSGVPTKTLSTDVYGNRFVSETKPAYRVYPEMGLKIHNAKNAHMLSQVAEEVVSKVDQNNLPVGILSANATTWSNQTTMLNNNEQPVNTKTLNDKEQNIWRKYQTYQWMPQERTGGMSAVSGFASFFQGGNSSGNWNLVSQIALYNKYSNALESFDMNGNYSALKMGYDQSKIVATASPANYYEMNYSGLEDGMLGNNLLARGFSLEAATIATGVSHTGERSAQLNAGQSGLTYTTNAGKLKAGRSYSASVWMKTAGDPSASSIYYRINGGAKIVAAVNISKKAGDWYLVSTQIPGSLIQGNITVEIGCINSGSATAYFDDIRFKPVNADMISYVYNNKTGELDYTLGTNNLFLKFQYDSDGKLIKTFKETFGYGVKQLSESIYNYAKSTSAIWKPTYSTRCQTIGGVTTGLRETEHKDTNPSSITYNQIKWIVTGSSSECGANPIPCSGPNKKYINGVCITGEKQYTRSVSLGSNRYTCYYRYSFYDGTYTSEFSEPSNYPCAID